MIYSAYGVTLKSEIALTEFHRGRGQPDVVVTREDVPRTLPGALISQHGYMARPGATWVAFGPIARCLATGGSRLMVQSAVGIDESSLRAYLVSTGLVALLQQRPGLVLQASAIGWGTGAILFIGCGAVGKSTLAALFSDRGHPVLSDEITRITVGADGLPIAHPGYPALKLWPDALRRLEGSWARPVPLRTGIGKRIVVVPKRFADRPLPIRGVILLNRSRNPGIHVQTILGAQNRFSRLAASAERLAGSPDIKLRSERFALMGSLGRLALFHELTWSTREAAFASVYDEVKAMLEALSVGGE